MNFENIYNKLKTYAQNNNLTAADIKALTDQQILTYLKNQGVTGVDLAQVANVRREIKELHELNEANNLITNIKSTLSATYPNVDARYDGEGVIVISLNGFDPGTPPVEEVE